MDLCLIHADENFSELCQIIEFESFSARLTLKEDEECDWELIMPTGTWEHCPVNTGHYIYIDNSEWGGQVERVLHISQDGQVKLQGTCWRGMLNRRIICPDAGCTHFELENSEANAAISELLGGWRYGLFSVSQEDSGFICSARLRYRPLLEALNDMLADAGCRLSVVFSDGTALLSAVPVRDMSDQVELSQEYDASLTTDLTARVYNHIIALGSGEMLDRQVVELWLKENGTVTDDPEEGALIESLSTMLYDYSAVESLENLELSARRKLLAQAGGHSMEIAMTDDIGLELTDIASVRDTVTGSSATLRVVSSELTVSSSGVTLTHCLSQ